MISHLEANELLDLYKDLLSPRQQEILCLYFQEDYSYTELQEELSISRAAAYDAVKKGIKAMEEYESILHLQAKTRALQQLAVKYPQLEQEIEAIIEM